MVLQNKASLKQLLAFKRKTPVVENLTEHLIWELNQQMEFQTCLSTYLSIYLSIYLYLSIYPSIYLSIYLSICLFYTSLHSNCNFPSCLLYHNSKLIQIQFITVIVKAFIWKSFFFFKKKNALQLICSEAFNMYISWITYYQIHYYQFRGFLWSFHLWLEKNNYYRMDDLVYFKSAF